MLLKLKTFLSKHNPNDDIIKFNNENLIIIFYI